MTDTIVILTEQAIHPADADRILALHEGETDLRYQVLVPHDVRRGLLVSVLDDLSLLDLRKLVQDLRREDPAEKEASAQRRLDTTIESLRARGAEAVGEITTDNPLPALGEAVANHEPREIIVITGPHAVEDTFHTDWASVARDTLGLPVLHLYAGTGYVG